MVFVRIQEIALKYCRSCVLPDSRPNLIIGEDGECNACKSHRTKPDIDWTRRERLFRELIGHAKAKGRPYDCLIPVSGGKDSTWQTLKCLEYGLVPLTFSYAPPLRTDLGRRNLDNLINLGVDHVDYRINPAVEKEFLRRGLERYGNIGTPMHTAIFSIARILAHRFEIPLIIWGEDSSAEYGGSKDEGKDYELNQSWLKKFGVGHGTSVEDWLGGALNSQNMFAYGGVPDSLLKDSDTTAVFLGYFFPWDPENTRNAAVSVGMQVLEGAARVGYWNYADLDDELISVHHYLKWFKFGFSRIFDNLSVEIRNGRLSRAEAIEIIRSTGDQTPHEDLEAFCRFTGLSRAQFNETAERFRNHDVWVFENGRWRIPGFLIDDWTW